VLDKQPRIELWAMLKKKMHKTTSNKLYLKQELYGPKVVEEEDLTKHINVFNRVTWNFGQLGIKVEK
jgi:hypothetical protein